MKCLHWFYSDSADIFRQDQAERHQCPCRSASVTPPSTGGSALSCCGISADCLGFKVGAERLLAFTGRPGLRPAPHLARARWVLTDSKPLPRAELAFLICAAYERISANLTRAQKQSPGIGASLRA